MNEDHSERLQQLLDAWQESGQLPEDCSAAELQALADHLWLGAVLERQLARPATDPAPATTARLFTQVMTLIRGMPQTQGQAATGLDDELASPSVVADSRASKSPVLASDSNPPASLSAEGPQVTETAPLAPYELRVQPLSRNAIKRLSWIGGALALAACILFVLMLPANTALAVVQRAKTNVLQEVDRAYRVTFSGPWKRRNQPQAKLHVRGAQKMAMMLAGPRGATFWLGRNGDKRWFVPPFGPATIRVNTPPVSGDASHGGDAPDLADESDELSYLELDVLLTRLEKQFELTKPRAETFGPEKIPAWLVTGTLKPAQKGPRLPHRVELWADRKTGAVMKLTLVWEIANSEPRQAILELESTVPQPSEFYDAEFHARSRRPPGLRP